MGLLGSHPGSWFGLPDFGITERFTSNRTAQGGSNILGPQSAQTPPPPPPPPQYGPQKPAVLGTSTSRPTNNFVAPDRQAQQQQQQSASGNWMDYYQGWNPDAAKQDFLQQFGGDVGRLQTARGFGGGGGGNAPSVMDMINEAYGQEQDYLNQVQSSLPGQAQTAKSSYDTLLNQQKPQYEAEQSARLGELQTRSDQAARTNQQETARVKQLLGELQNRQASQLAYTGGYGSSSNPAMAEAFGKQAFSSLSTLAGQNQNVTDSINSERERVKNFYSKSIGDLTTQVATAKNQIDVDLQDKLNQIAGAKAESAKAKAQATMSAWQDYANRVAQLNLEKTQWQQNLEAWALEKGQTLDQAHQFALNATGSFNPTAYTFAPNQSPSLNMSAGNSMAYAAPVKVNRASGNYTEEEKRLASVYGLTPDQIKQIQASTGMYQTFS